MRRARGPLLVLLLALTATCGNVKHVTSTPALIAHLESADPSERAYAVAQLARRGEPKAVPGLVARLRDEDGGIRLMTAAALREMTGRNMGYRPFAPEAEREKAVLRWEAWLDTRDGGSSTP